jgi:transketolase
MRDMYGEALLELGEEDSRVVVIGADTTQSIKASVFGSRFPERFFNVGIAEANLVSIAAGLAASGKIAFASTYAIFAIGKCVDQIRNAIAYPKLDVKIVASHAGVSVGPDGASHQEVEDIATMRAIPNMRVVSPADAVSAKKLVKQVAHIPGPFYVRIARPSTPVVYRWDEELEVGKAKILHEGSDVSIIACGLLVPESLTAAKELSKQGVKAEVLDLHTIKPIDSRAIIETAQKTGGVVTAEEHNILGGLGGAVSEVLAQEYPTRVVRVGVNDTFGESGEHKELMAKYGLTSKEIVRAALAVSKKKTR